ncbi:hypothetical protein ABIC65_002299 [Sphingomonas trueperi]|uniref:MFS transporter n=1 Tax=Sphingomonas trueperi TaxID=53317 RepID=UPI003393467E
MATIPADDTRFRIASPPIRADEPPAWRLIGFASLAVPIAGAGLPLILFVPQLYASHYGLSLATIGLIFFLGRFWDVAADPIVGVLSDRTRSRFGRRRPWIAAGGLLFGRVRRCSSSRPRPWRRSTSRRRCSSSTPDGR